jgi:hypothetical protein
MNHIVKDIIDYTNEKTPLYKIIYVEPEMEDDGNCLTLSVNIKTIILDFETWKSNIPQLYFDIDWNEDKILEKWNMVINKDTTDINREYFTGQIDADNNTIYCRKLSVVLLN